MNSELATAKRIVVKVGSSLVTNRGQGLDHSALARWVSQIAELRRLGREVVIVSSGAIAEGMQRLGWKKTSQRASRAAGGGCGRPDGRH